MNSGRLDIPLVLRAILDECALSPDGDHGVGHWARVLENGLRLAEKTAANIEVVQLFALFHDSKRVRETSDPNMGDSVLSSPPNCEVTHKAVSQRS